jgi:hypothetical protein
MKKSIPFLFASILFFAASCKKDDPLNTDKLPPATTSGKNTFGCKINGKVWLPAGGTLWDSPISAKHDMGWVGCDQLYIGVKRVIGDDTADIDQHLILNVWCPALGENTITPGDGVFIDFNNCGYYRVDTLSPYILSITRLDSINFIASGTFELTVINDDCEDTLRITEGRFDVDTHL